MIHAVGPRGEMNKWNFIQFSKTTFFFFFLRLCFFLKKTTPWICKELDLQTFKAFLNSLGLGKWSQKNQLILELLQTSVIYIALQQKQW